MIITPNIYIYTNKVKQINWNFLRVWYLSVNGSVTWNKATCPDFIAQASIVELILVVVIIWSIQHMSETNSNNNYSFYLTFSTQKYLLTILKQIFLKMTVWTILKQIIQEIYKYTKNTQIDWFHTFLNSFSSVALTLSVNFPFSR